jgi:hypothetical protein
MPIRTTIVTNSASEFAHFFHDPAAMYLDRFLDGTEICGDLRIDLAGNEAT